MKKLFFECNRDQRSALEGLAYRIADTAYMRERFGSDEPELKQNEKTISGLFDELDRLGVPFWVQNSVICFSENWRKYIQFGIFEPMKEKNIILRRFSRGASSRPQDFPAKAGYFRKWRKNNVVYIKRICKKGKRI